MQPELNLRPRLSLGKILIGTSEEAALATTPCHPDENNFRQVNVEPVTT
jgi:hypothetical protein